ncbi:TraB/GumN family protein [Sphingomonas donggukensis]|uniref:TraB/GumN family protein n=1 Tax=Sphingomonas donggukensis TaxID=2949093 RepID=A0ABY4TU94_9SPHN|nr:TraB/GumN family protein [Sphingomonas donggukensis]URW75974.1 TraB/GumN family protein [Sphingomonas donggukensis]
MPALKSLLTGAMTLAALCALPACAQPAPAPKATPTAANDADPALWVVKDKDTTIYLFGTVHVLKPGLTWFDEAVKSAFDKSDTLVLEMVEPDAATMQGIVMAKAIAPTGAPTLTQRLPADKRAAFTTAIAEAGIPGAAAERLKPWFASIAISMVPIRKAGYDGDQGPEKILTAAAKAAGKTVTGLETAEQQIGYFDGLSDGAQVTFLTSTLDELPKGAATLDTMVADWSAGRTDALAKTMNDGLKDSPEVAAKILYDRNARWATWIGERMQKPGTVFVAVGAGHLAGDKSVIADLATKKLKAVRVKY